jgi:branched-chain amino acid transport system substrate-binding protein
MTTRRALFAAAAAAALALGAGPASAQQGQPVRIGMVLSATGGLAPFVPPIRAAAQLAAQQINAAGGVLNGRMIELVEADDQTNPQAGVAAATRLVQVDGVVAMVGPMGSGITIPVAQTVTIPAGVTVVSPSATSPAISGLSDNDTVFRTAVPDGLQGRVLARVVRERGIERVAVMAVNNDYGRGLQNTFTEAFTAAGGTVTSAQNFEENRASYRSELSNAASQGSPQALMVVGYPASGGNTILRQALENGFFDRFVMTDGMRDPSVVETVGAQNLGTSVGTSGGSAAAPAQLEAYVNAYRAANPNLDPTAAFSPQMYDAVIAIALAIQKAGSADRAAIARNLRDVSNGPGTAVGPGEFARAKELLAAGTDIDYQGASGPLEFNEAGDAAGAIDVWAVQGGRIATLETVAR